MLRTKQKDRAKLQYDKRRRPKILLFALQSMLACGGGSLITI